MPRCLYLWANKFFTYRAGVVGEKISPSGTHAILETPLLFLPDRIPIYMSEKAEYRSKNDNSAKPEKEKLPRNICYAMCGAQFD